MSADGRKRKISEDEVRVKEFIIQEIKSDPSRWKKVHSEDWESVLLNMREAFKNDPKLLTKYKVDTVPGTQFN